jgi:ankyrin repeat protein
MHVAAMTGQTKVFQIMLEKAVDKNPKDDNWDTPLHSAAKGGHYTICKLIIDAGIRDNNPRNKNDETPLGLATSNNHTEVGLLIHESVGSSQRRRQRRRGVRPCEVRPP